MAKGDLSPKVAGRPFAWHDKVALVWFLLDAFTHLSIEFVYTYVTWVYGGAENAPKGSLMAKPWLEYARADARWARFDTTVLSLELITVFAMGPLALAMMYAIWHRKPWRHAAQVIICTSELYGGFMTFVPDWLMGSPNLTNDPWMVWIYLFFMNALWVFVPLVLLYDSFVKLTAAAEKAKTEADDSTPAGAFWYNAIVATLVLYVILVPYALATAQA